MAISTYAELKTSIANWMNRASDTTFVAAVPDFVALCEARVARDLRHRLQVVATTLTTTAGVQAVDLPSDFLEAENLTITSTTPYGNVSVVTPEILNRKFPDSDFTGQPQVYAYLGDTLLFGPTPDAAYTISLDYYQRLDLSNTGANWLLTKYPGVYLAGSMVEACLFQKDTEAMGIWDAKYRAEVGQVQAADDEALRSGSAMRVRTL